MAEEERGFGAPVEGMRRGAEVWRFGAMHEGRLKVRWVMGISWDGYRMCDSGESELESGFIGSPYVVVTN